MRSVRLFAGALVLLLGVPLAIAAAAAFDGAAGVVIHAALGLSFLLIASAAFDLKLPIWLSAPACLALGALGIIFLLQGAADLLHADALGRLAYDVLGQRLEKILGYAFLVWCLALLCLASGGGLRILGALVLAIVAGVEIYTLALVLGGAQAPEWLKLLYLPTFVWLGLEGMRRPLREIA